MTEKRRELISAVGVVSAGVLWGIIGIFTRKLSKSGFSAIELVSVRAFITVILMAVYLLFKNKKLFLIKPRDLVWFFGTGCLSFVFFNFCYFNSMKYSSLSEAAILLYTAPIFVTVMSRIFFRENITAQKLIAVLGTFVGCFLVCATFGKTALSPIGLLYGLGSGFGYALYSIFARVVVDRYSTLTITFYTFLFAALGTVFFVNPIKLAEKAVAADEVLFCILIAIASTVIPYLLYTHGLSGLSNSTAAVLATVEPCVASVVGFAVFSEKAFWWNIVGIIIVILSVAVGNFNLKRHNKN